MTQETTPADPRLDEWAQLANAATPGPWEVGDNDKNDQAIVRTEHLELFTGWHHYVGAIEEEMHANAAFVAAAREAIPALIAMVRKLDREREQLALAICGGEDAPGYANAQTVETLVEIARQQHLSHGADIDRATVAEARVAVLEGLMAQSRPYLEAAANDYLKCPLTGSPEEAQILVASIGRAEK